MNKSLIAALLASVVPLCHSRTHLICIAEDKRLAWVQRIEIDPERKQAHLSVAWSLPVAASDMGRLEATIEDMTEVQDGVPIYAFNAYPQGQIELTNMFKLFRLGGKWRLVGAAYATKKGKPALRGIDTSVAYKCRHEG